MQVVKGAIRPSCKKEILFKCAAASRAMEDKNSKIDYDKKAKQKQENSPQDGINLWVTMILLSSFEITRWARDGTVLSLLNLK